MMVVFIDEILHKPPPRILDSGNDQFGLTPNTSDVGGIISEYPKEALKMDKKGKNR